MGGFIINPFIFGGIATISPGATPLDLSSYNEALASYVLLPLDSTHALLAYRDESDAQKGKAVVLTISGSSVTAGTSTTFKSSSAVGPLSGALISSSRALLVWGSNSGGCTVDISGTSVTANTVTTSSAPTASSYEISLVVADPTVAAVFYHSGSVAYTVKEIALSGTSVTFGSTDANGAVVNSGTYANSCLIDYSSSTGKQLIVFRDGNSNSGKACIALFTTSGVSFGTAVTITASDQINGNGCIFVSKISTSAALIVWSSETALNAQVVSISGTAITTNTTVALKSGAASRISIAQIDSSTYIVGFQDDSDGNKFKTLTAKISGTTPSLQGSVVTIDSGSGCEALTLIPLSSSQLLAAYEVPGGFTNNCRVRVINYS